MSSPLQLLMMVAPLAWYFYLLAVWQAGRHPRVVPGPLDVALLAMGVGGLVAFGPIGEFLLRIPDGRPDLVRRLFWALLAILAVRAWARRASRRLVIYHVDPAALESILREALGPEEFLRTVDGFEDRARTRRVRLESSPRWQWAAIEAVGRDPGGLIRDLGPRLRERLGAVPTRLTEVPLILFALSTLTMLVPMTGYLLAQPRARAVLRVLLEHLQGG